MEKDQVISFLKTQLEKGTVTRENVLDLVNEYEKTVTESKASSSRNLINVFYAIGAVIVIVGIIILLGQHWYQIGFVGRILATLGISVATYVSAILLKTPSQRTISQILFTISAFLSPIGSYVLLNEASIRFDTIHQIYVAVSLFIIFGLAQIISRKNVLVLFMVAFATWLYYLILIKIFDVSYFSADVMKWATIFAGLSYILIAYGYSLAFNSDENPKEKLAVCGFLHSFGTLGILGAGITIGGNFDFVLILIIFGIFYASVFLQSKSMLIITALFLMGHIIKLTSRFFVDSIGWPVSLVILGFVIIGIGYVTFYINRKYLDSKTQ